MIGVGAGLLILAVVISKVQSRRMKDDSEEEKTLEDDQE
jgi:hypothetical protein